MNDESGAQGNGRWTSGRTRVARRAGLSPLARDIVVILIVKLLALTALWFAFFRAPAAPHLTMEPRQVEHRLLSPAPLPQPAAPEAESRASR